MELAIKSREVGKKGDTKRIRRTGDIPAVIYAQDNKSLPITVDGAAFRKVLNSIESGTLASCVFSLQQGEVAMRAIIKDIQYHVTTYNVLHLDFEQLQESTPVTLNIPIRCLNAVDCIGVKLGNVLRQTLRLLKARCLPDRIPQAIDIDVQSMGLGDAFLVKDLKLPADVHPLEDPKKVVVVVARK